MSILIVSANPLFKEVIVETAAKYRSEIVELSPEEALTKTCELKPNVIILDIDHLLNAGELSAIDGLGG